MELKLNQPYEVTQGLIDYFATERGRLIHTSGVVGSLVLLLGRNKFRLDDSPIWFAALSRYGSEFTESLLDSDYDSPTNFVFYVNVI